MRAMRAFCIVVAVFFVAALRASAQDRPDFTGTWIRLEVGSSSDSHVERISQRGNRLTVDVESKGSFGTMGTSSKSVHTYTIGGPVESNEAPDGSLRSVAVAWDGSKLVFLRTTRDGANTTTEREAWSLEEGGAMLFKERRTTDWRGTRDGRVVLQRREMGRGGFQVYGVSGKPCRAWVSERSAPEGAANLQWVLGYVTAYGVDRAFRVAAGGDTAGQLRPTNAEEIAQLIDKYCTDRHPDSDLWRAADDLIRQLGGTRPMPAPNLPVREYR